MKVLTLISGGDTGGAKTHVHTLLAGLGGKVQVKMVCFTEGPFAQEARELGIDTEVLSSRNFFKNLNILTRMVREEGFDILHSHGSRGNMMSALLGRRTDSAAVSLNNSLRDKKPKTATANLLFYLLAALEESENTLSFFRADPWTLICN